MKFRIDNLIGLLLTFFGFVLLIDLQRIIGEHSAVSFIQSAIKGAMYIGSILLFLLFSGGKKQLLSNAPMLSLVLYVVVCGLSIFWSHFLSDTIVGGISLLGACCMGVMANKYLGLNRTIHYFLRGVEIVILVSFIYLVLGKEAYMFLQGIERYVGITYGPHALARGAALVFLYRLWGLTSSLNNSYGSKVSCFLILAICLFSIVKADSRQVMGALIIASSYILWVKSKKAFLLGGVASIAGVVVYLIQSQLILLPGVSIEFLYRANVDELTTFTGRTFIWLSSLRLIEEAPILGYGFNAGGGVLESSYSTLFGWSTRSAHNAVLHALLDVGIIGLISLLVWYFSLWKVMLQTRSSFIIASLIFLTIVCVIERIIAGNVGFSMFYLILLTGAISSMQLPNRRKS